MTHGSLFSGIGGFDLAAEWMGWENKFHCEWNPFGQIVLHHYWPNAEQFTDITKSNFKKYAGSIDIISGGFPCQPYSQAGKRLGKEDERHLWPEMLRVIREVSPSWVVGENVRGLTNWNGGMVFDEVQADLENIGYEVTPFLLPACAVNAPHRRDRIWFIAYNHSFRFKRYAEQTGDRNNTTKRDRINKFCEKQGRNEIWSINEGNCEDWNATNSDSNEQQRSDSKHEIDASKGGKYAQRNFEQMGRYVADTGNEQLQRGKFNRSIRSKREIKTNCGQSCRPICSKWEIFPTVPPICYGNDGLSDKLDGITFSKWRQESIKAGGNAIVPQVALQIFKAIEQYERIRNPAGCH